MPPPPPKLAQANSLLSPHATDILHRKSDVRKKGRTRGWEMMLSHRFATGVTSGFVKGTPSSDVVGALKHVRACAAQVGHPLLLPTIILAHDLSPANDQKQRDARDWLRHLEQAVSMRDEVEVEAQYFQNGRLEVDGLNRDLVECHSNVLWKRPQAYMALTLEMEKAMAMFKDMHEATAAAARTDGEGGQGGEEEAAVARERHRRELDRLHRSMLARMDFYKVKLTGLENYIHTTLQRLKVQREAVSLLFFVAVERIVQGRMQERLTENPRGRIALQHHVAARSPSQPRNRRRAAPHRPRQQARQHRHEDDFPARHALSPRHLSRVCIQHDVFQLSVL